MVVAVDEARKGLLTWYQKAHIHTRIHVSCYCLQSGASADPTLLGPGLKSVS